jgi:glycosyltransferase involved in cell wall biosynthesis
MKPRILIIENSTAVTGALKSIIRSSQGLKEDYTFIFVLPKNSSAIKLVQESGFEAHELSMKELRKNIFSFVTYFPTLLYNSARLSRLINTLKIDLITVNDFYNLLPVGYKFFQGKIPYVCYVRFLPSKFPKALVKFWCALHQRYAFSTIAVSDAVRRELPYKKNVVVIGNELPGEETPFISSASSRLILYPANYIQGKGQEFALQSFALVYKKHTEWKLLFVGGDMDLQKNKDFKKDLLKLAKSLHIDQQVGWDGFEEKISDAYLKAGLVLNFSESESFSMTCLEAMFYGRPVIATRSGGPSEIIEQNDTGILIDVKDISAMANAIDYLISHPNEREVMAKRAYASVRQKFSYANTIEKLGHLYRKAIKEHSI